MSVQQFVNYVKFMLEAELIRTAPVDTGRLKNSIRIEFENNKLNIIMVYYGIYVEFGTKFMQPQPFIRNALYNKLPIILKDGVNKYLPGATVSLSF